MHSRSDRRYPWTESVILFVACFLAYELKRQFGLFAHRLLGAGGDAHEAFLGLGAPELVTLAIVIAGLSVYQRTALPNAPWLERLIYRDRATPKRILIWRPAIVAALITMAVALVLALLAQHLGYHPARLSVAGKPSNVTHADLIKLWSLYPLAAIGAPIDEEIHFRLGLVSILVFLLALAAPRANRRGVLLLWLPIVVAGFYFGYVHVMENLETVQTGNLYLSVLIAPQTWAGIIFGYVFCTWGLEAAIATHFLSDISVPVLIAGLSRLAH